MRVFFLILAAAFAMVGCSQNQKPSGLELKTEEKTQNSQAVASDGKVSYLSTSDFKKKVMDYDAHPQEWVFAGSRPAVIDFYATWCRPCKMMSPVVEQLALKYAGKIDFYKVDIDKESELAAVFGIQSIPTFLFIPVKGNPSAQMGAMEKEEFEKIIKEKLGE